MTDIFTVISDDMPLGIKGHVNHNIDGSYTIFINAKLTYEEQKEVFNHELQHIKNNDFEKFNCDVIEQYAHNGKKSG